MKKITVVLMLVLLLASCSKQTGLSLDEYEQLTEGLSYNTVVLIAGLEGELLSGSTACGNITKYQWHGYGDNGASAILEFEDGLLTAMSQQGLHAAQIPANLGISYDAFIDAFLQTVIFAAGGFDTGEISLNNYDYEPLEDGAAMRSYTIWQSPEGGFVRLQALCDKNDDMISIETIYDAITGNPEADMLYAKCKAYSLRAYIMARYSLDVMAEDIQVLYDKLQSQGSLGFTELTELQDGAVSTYSIATAQQ